MNSFESEYNKLLKETENKKHLMTKKLKKEIKKLYADVYKEYDAKLFKAKRGTLGEKFILDARKELKAKISALNDDIYNKITKDMERLTSDMTSRQLDIWLDINKEYSLDLDDTFKAMFNSIHDNVIAEILGGKLYRDGAGLSKGLWNHGKIIDKDIQNILAAGAAKKESNITIANKLSKYLNPGSYKRAVYGARNRKIEFNSYRLAHTAISNAYQQTVRRSASGNPFVEAIRWISSNDRRTCELCQSRHNRLFSPDSKGEYEELPMDHPLGRCCHSYEIPKTYEEIGKELNRWVNGEKNEKIDNWFNAYKK